MKAVIAVALLLAFGGIRMSLAAGRNELVEGNPQSTVRVVIYEDLQCSDCARLRTLLDEKILPRYGSRVAFVHRDFPLGKHDWARIAAIAGRWIAEQSPAAAVSFRREILAEQAHLSTHTLPAWLDEFAARYKLDAKALAGSLKDARLAALVDQDLASGAARTITRVPSVFLGSVALVETVVEDDLAHAIDEALK